MGVLAIVAVAIAAGGALYKGAETKKLKELEAKGLHEAANRRLGAAHREAAEEERNKDFVYSRALAVSAFSGGGTSDPGMVALFGDLNAEGEYRILSRLYAGEDEAEGLKFRAEIAKREGEAAETASYFDAVSSGISAYSGFA